MIRRIHAPTIPERKRSKYLTPALVLASISLLALFCMTSAWMAARTLSAAFLSIP